MSYDSRRISDHTYEQEKKETRKGKKKWRKNKLEEMRKWKRKKEHKVMKREEKTEV